MIHKEPFIDAGKTVKIVFEEELVEYDIEDWWDRVSGSSWMFASGNIACMNYAMRSGLSKLPIDNEVLYGKIGCFGYLIHISEIKVK